MMLLVLRLWAVFFVIMLTSNSPAVLYVNVTLSEDSRIVKRSIVAVPSDKTIGDLIELSGWVDNGSKQIVQIKAGQRIDAETTDVNMTTPVCVLQNFGLSSVRVELKNASGVTNEVQPNPDTRPTAFDKLMASRKSTFLPDRKSDQTKANNRLYNDFLSTLKEENIGWPVETVNTTGRKIVSVLTSALWYIEAQHDKLSQRGCHMPEMFKTFKGYCDHRASHKKLPSMEASKLEDHIQALSEILMFPWFGRSANADLAKATNSLVEMLKRYLDFLQGQQARTAKRQRTDTPLRGPDDSFSLLTLEASTSSIAKYEVLRAELEKSDFYQPVALDDMVPDNRYHRRHWLDEMAFPFPVAKFTYHHGNYLGNLVFVWRLPTRTEDRSDEQTIKAVTSVKQKVKLYATREMRKTFFDRYQNVPNLTPAILRKVYSDLTADASAAETHQQTVVDQRVAEFLLSTSEEEVFYDLRKLNGNPGSTKFDEFWDETQKFIEEMTPAVQERRHGQHLYLPFVLSIEDLRETVSKRLPSTSLIPSNEWLRLQFWPKNTTSLRALQHTGRFNLKFAVQQRLLRVSHPDAKYAAVLYRYMRAFAIKYREISTLLYLDDKAVIPLGEPDCPVATGARAHNRVLTPLNGPLLALDHDFHVHGVVPSVCFKSYIPEQISDTFFQGQVFVTCKNKVFQPSDAVRHGAEVLKILRNNYSEDGCVLNTPILLCYTDGGPDHRTTYPSVQLASVALFMLLDLDMFVTCRTAPCQSYANLAERVNSVLNLALQNVALARGKMDDSSEKRVKSLSSMKKIRIAADKSTNLKNSLIESVKPVIHLLEERFQRLKLKEQPISTPSASSNEDMEDFVNSLKLVDQDFNTSSLSKNSMKLSPKMTNFFDRHCRKRHYVFQIRKCQTDADTCWYCSLCPPRMEPELFSELQYIPDPVLTTDKSKYEEFEQLYGQETDDSSRPSAQLGGVCERDQLHKPMLVSAKVRSTVVCVECAKPRCVFANKKLEAPEMRALETVRNSDTFVCGDSLFPVDTLYHDSVVVKEGLRCGDPMEVAYYSAKLVKLPDCCYYCASLGPLSEDEDIRNLRANYSVVRSICCNCKSSGKEPAVRAAKNVKKS